MSKINTFLLTLCIFCISSPLLSAQSEMWKADLTEKLGFVGWIEQSNDGVIIASGDNGILGLDNNTGKELWFHDEVKAAVRSSYYAMDGLPIFFVKASNLTGKQRGLLINSSTGDIIFDSKSEDVKLGKNHVFADQGLIVFEVIQDGKNKLLAFNFIDGKVVWNTEIGEAPGKLGALMKGNSFLRFSPMTMANSDVLLVEPKRVTVIDFSNGKIRWNNEFKDRIKSANYSGSDNNIYLGLKKDLMILTADAGSDVTPDKVRMKGTLEQLMTNEAGNIVLVDDKGVNILDVTKKEFMWKKPFGISGVSEVWELDGHYYFIANNEGGVTKVDQNGKKVWDESIRGYAYYIIPIDQGIYYLSTERSNVLAYADGESLWKKDVKFRTIPSVDVSKNGDKVAFFEGKELFTFDLNSLKIDELKDDIKFEKSKEVIFYMEARDNGYLIHGDQHMAFYDTKGKEVYNSYFKPVSTSDGLMVLGSIAGAMVGVDVQGTLATVESLDRISKGSWNSSGDQSEANSKSSVIAGVYANSSPMIEVTKTRYFNSRDVKDHKYILTNSSEGNVVLRVHKETGKTDKTLKLDDKTPSYVVDSVDDRVFINEKNKVVTGYDMKK